MHANKFFSNIPPKSTTIVKFIFAQKIILLIITEINPVPVYINIKEVLFYYNNGYIEFIRTNNIKIKAYLLICPFNKYDLYSIINTQKRSELICVIINQSSFLFHIKLIKNICDEKWHKKVRKEKEKLIVNQKKNRLRMYYTLATPYRAKFNCL